LLDIQRDALAALVELAVAGCEDLALLRLLLGGVGEHEPTGSGLLLLDRPHDQTIAQGLQLHVVEPPFRSLLLPARHRWETGLDSLALSGGECQVQIKYIEDLGKNRPFRNKNRARALAGRAARLVLGAAEALDRLGHRRGRIEDLREAD